METYVSKAAEVTCEKNAFAELAVYSPMTHCIPDVPFKTFKTPSAGTRRIFTQQDDDLLTPEETKQHWPEIEAATLKELLTWAKVFQQEAKTHGT